MPRFDVFRNEYANSNRRFPFFLTLQSELLQELSTCVIAPLGRPSVVGGRLVQTLSPELDVEGEHYVLYVPELAAVPVAVLRRRVANLEAQRDTILRALDFLFSGI
jgi:toxin CcdB